MRRCPTPEPIITPPSALPHATQPVRSNAILALPKAAHRVRWGMTLKGAESNHSRAMEAEEVFDQFLDSFRKRISKAVAALQVSGAFAGHGSAAERLTDVRWRSSCARGSSG